MSEKFSLPDQRRLYSILAVLLMAVGAVVLLCNNAGYFFGARLYEDGDLAANTIEVLEAKNFHELYGAYSRWGFHHPGPGLFYGYAWSELILYDWFRLTRSGFAAQLIGAMLLSLGFLTGGLCVAARWVRTGVFLPAMLLLATLHCVAINPQSSLLGAWTPYAMLMVYFALVMAAASVACGQGDDLPLLVTAGSLLIHIHVAQPLFVLPLFALAYAGLCWHTWRAGAAARFAGLGAAVPRLPWMRFPRRHVYAGLLAFVFVLPLLVDLSRGAESNLAKIIEHLRTHKGERHAWIDSVFYFLRYGAYKPSAGDEYTYPTGATARQVLDYLGSHWVLYGLWLACLAVSVAASALRYARRRTHAGVVPGEPLADAPETEEQRLAIEAVWRGRFLRVVSGIWLLLVVLTLFWGRIMDGEMFYFNAWFNYSIWLTLGLIGVASCGDLLAALVPRTPLMLRAVHAAALICLVAVVCLFFLRAGSFRAAIYDTEESRTQAHTVLASLAAHPDAPKVKYLIFPQLAWPVATATTVLLMRQGITPRVPLHWITMFGPDHAQENPLAGLPAKSDDSPIDVWRLFLAKDHPELKNYPMLGGYVLMDAQPEVDPTRTPSIEFGSHYHNMEYFVVNGWSEPSDQAEYLWSTGKTGLLAFRTKPVGVDDQVEIVFDCQPYVVEGKLTRQRFALALNGDEIGTLSVDAQSGRQRPWLHVPAKVWNRHPHALLTVRFLDAVAPRDFGQGEDTRQLALATKSIVFRNVKGNENPLLSGALQYPKICPATPGADAEIRFGGDRPNFVPFVLEGWPGEAEKGALFTFTVGHQSALAFQRERIAEGESVQVGFDCFSYTGGGRLEQQRCRVSVNGTEAGSFSVDANSADKSSPMLRVNIPAALWNQYATVRLTLDLPDAISPKEAENSLDARLLALGMRRIVFRVLKAGDNPQLDVASQYPKLDPNAGVELRFTGASPNFAPYVLEGWEPYSPQSPITYSVGNKGVLGFVRERVPDGTAVEVSFDAAPYPGMGKIPRQRCRVSVNGTEVGTCSVEARAVGGELPKVSIPAAAWNRYAALCLTLDFLDAASPKSLGENGDTRRLALGTRRIIFRVTDAPESEKK